MVRHKSGILETAKHTTGEFFRKLPEKLMRGMGALAIVTIGVTGCGTEGHGPNKGVTTATPPSPADYYPTDATEPPSPEKTMEQKYKEALPPKPVDVDETAARLNSGENPLEVLPEFITKQGLPFPHIDEKVGLGSNCISTKYPDIADALSSQIGSVTTITDMLNNPEYNLNEQSVDDITNAIAQAYVDPRYQKKFVEEAQSTRVRIPRRLERSDLSDVEVSGYGNSATSVARASEGGCFGAWATAKDVWDGLGEKQPDLHGFFQTDFFRKYSYDKYSGVIQNTSIEQVRATFNQLGLNPNLGIDAKIFYRDGFLEATYKVDGVETKIEAESR